MTQNHTNSMNLIKIEFDKSDCAELIEIIGLYGQKMGGEWEKWSSYIYKKIQSAVDFSQSLSRVSIELYEQNWKAINNAIQITCKGLGGDYPNWSQKINDVINNSLQIEVLPPSLEQEISNHQPSQKVEKAVLDCLNKGWILLNRGEGTAQITKPKKFSWFLFVFLAVFTFEVAGAAGWIYLLIFLSIKQKIVVFSTNEEGELLINGNVEIPKYLREPLGVQNETESPLNGSNSETYQKDSQPNSNIVPYLLLGGIALIILVIFIASSIH